MELCLKGRVARIDGKGDMKVLWDGVGKKWLMKVPLEKVRVDVGEVTEGGCVDVTEEKRIDAEDGEAYTWDEMWWHCAGKCQQFAFVAYWRRMKPLNKKVVERRTLVVNKIRMRFQRRGALRTSTCPNTISARPAPPRQKPPP